MKRKLLSMLFFMLSLSVAAWAQDRTVSGVVNGDDGAPLPGVTVLVKGTSAGGVTDINGNYKILIPEGGATLIFSFVGYKTQEVDINSQTSINVTLATDAKALEEVVVTALGVERQRRDLGYAVSTVKGDDLTFARETNIVNSLQGKVSGVQITQQSGNVGGSTKILIRGISSLSGNNNPLWVVDGVPISDDNIATGSRITGGYDVGNRAQDINPDDIESINVLKGANAAALYGSRAANGVIVVTTKKGKRGNSGNVTFSSSVRFDNPLRLPSFQNQYGPGTLGKYDANFGGGWGPSINAVSGQTFTDFAGDEVTLSAQPDNVKDFYETGSLLINNIAFSGGNETNDFRLSVTSLNQEGISPGSALDRTTVSMNAGSKFTNKVSARFGVNYVRTTSEGRAAQGANDPNVLTNILNTLPRTVDINKLQPWKNEDGTQRNNLDDFTNNPFWIAHENKFDTEVDRLFGNLTLTYDPFDFLKFNTRVGYDILTDDRFVSNQIGTIGRENGSFTEDQIQQRQITVDFFATYAKDFNQDFSIGANVGYQLNTRVVERLTNSAQELTIANLFSPGNAGVNNPTNDFSERRLFGVFADVTLSYRDWLSLNVTGRNDWTSTLPDGDNSYFYPSVNTSFIFTDALGISNNILSYGKLRASWANVGGDTGPYQLAFNYFADTGVFGQYGTGNTFPFGGTLAFVATNTVPPLSLKPENQNSFEIGTELQFFEGRLGLDFSYYDIRTEDQILAIPTPETTGFGFVRTNVGTTSNKGIELELNGDVIKTPSFTWNALVTFTTNDFIVEELADGVEELIVNSGFNGLQVKATPGESYGLFGREFLRDETTGEILIDPSTGLRQQGDVTRYGSVLPDFIAGITNNLNYKGLNLRFTVDWREGGVLFSNTVGALRRAGVAEETAFNREGTFIDSQGVILNEDGTVRPNDVPVSNMEAFWGRYSDSNIQESSVFDASFIKLREISLSYTLPQNLVEKLPFKSVSVGFEARNVAILKSNIPHIDPETNIFGSANDGAGVERGSLPSTRSIGGNIRLTF